MKKTMIGLLFCALIVFSFGASVDRRDDSPRFPIAKKQIVQQSWASGESGVKSPTIANVNMLVERVDVVASNSTNAITYTVAISDEQSVSGGELYSKTGVTENAQTVHLATKATPDFDAFPVSNNTLTITITPSGDPGASGATVDVILYGP